MTDGKVLVFFAAVAGLAAAQGCSSTTLPPGTPIDLVGAPRCDPPLNPGSGSASAGCADGGYPTGLADLGDLGEPGTRGLLVVPADGGAPLPLIWVFHGSFGTVESMRGWFQLEAVTDGGAIIAYLQARRGTWDVGPGSTDVTQVKGLTAEISRRYCVDPARVFAVGFSAGAVFTLDLGCQSPEGFRAITAVAGTEDRFDSRCCKGKQSALLIHGDADHTIDIGGSGEVIDRIIAADACSSVSQRLDANCVEYPGCSDGKALVFCEHQGGHEVPPWAGTETWNFFQRFQ